MQGIDDPNVHAGDWWTQNAPPSNAGGYTAATIGNAGQGFHTTSDASGTPTNAPPGYRWDASVASFVPDGSSAGAASGPPTLNIHDPASVKAYVAYYASQPGANPSLTRDPTYWEGKISSGELGADPNYIIDKFMTPEGAPAGGGGAANPGALPETPFGGIGSTPSPYVNPTWGGGPAPTGPSLTNFTAPTLTELQGSPGYQSRLEAGLQAKNRSAAAQGSVLSGGTQQELARYGQDYASNEYGNLFGQKLAGVQANNQTAQTGFGNAFQTYQQNYGNFMNSAAMGKGAYDTNVANARNAGNDYWSHLNDLYQTGAGLAGSSYKPSNVP